MQATARSFVMLKFFFFPGLTPFSSRIQPQIPCNKSRVAVRRKPKRASCWGWRVCPHSGDGEADRKLRKVVKHSFRDSNNW